MRKKNKKSKEQKQTGKTSLMKNVVSDLIFYGILISLVVAALTISGKSEAGPRMFGGYSALVVLTGSMEEVIPKGSLVVTKKVDPLELKVGDDITYMVSENTSVTHRIIEIQEDYLGTGERAFRTQGVMNKEPDMNPVAAVNVVGKVIYHNKALGTVVNYGQDNWPLIIFFICIFLFFVKTVDFILRKDETGKKRTLEHSEENSKAGSKTIEDEDGFVLEIIEL